MGAQIRTLVYDNHSVPNQTNKLWDARIFGWLGESGVQWRLLQDVMLTSRRSVGKRCTASPESHAYPDLKAGSLNGYDPKLYDDTSRIRFRREHMHSDAGGRTCWVRFTGVISLATAYTGLFRVLQDIVP